MSNHLGPFLGDMLKAVVTRLQTANTPSLIQVTNTQHTTHNTQYTTHNTQHTTHNTQNTFCCYLLCAHWDIACDDSHFRLKVNAKVFAVVCYISVGREKGPTAPSHEKKEARGERGGGKRMGGKCIDFGLCVSE